MIKIITTKDMSCYRSLILKDTIFEVEDVTPNGYLTGGNKIIPIDCCKILPEPKFKIGERVKDKTLHIYWVIKSFEFKCGNYWYCCVVDKDKGSMIAEYKLIKVEPKFKVGDRIIYNSATMIDMLNRKLRRGDEGVIIDSSKKSDIWRVEFTYGRGRDKTSSVRFIEEKCLDLKKPEPKFEVGMNVKVTDNISNSLIGLIGEVKSRKCYHTGKFSYLIDFRKINSWRDLTWVIEEELEIYHEKPVKTELTIVNFHIWDWLKGKHKLESMDSIDKICEDKDVFERFYSQSRIIDEHIIKENKMEEKKYVCPKHADCVVALDCKRALPYEHIESGDFKCDKCPICIEFKKGENCIENKLDNLKKKFKELGAEIEKLEKEEKSKKDDYVLKVRVGSYNCLEIIYTYGKGYVRPLGLIDSNGKCCILNTVDAVNNYELWREHGMKVCSDKVEWRGNRYYISPDLNLSNWNYDALIYDFDHCVTLEQCQDPNIVRFKHNNRPIGF